MSYDGDEERYPLHAAAAKGQLTNLAAKLCTVAQPGEILASCEPDDLPAWIHVRKVGEVNIRGVGAIDGILRLGVSVR